MKKCNKIIASLLAGVLLVSSVGVLPAEASASDATVLIQEDFEGGDGDFVVNNPTLSAGEDSTIKEYTSGSFVKHNGYINTNGNHYRVVADVMEDDGNNILQITQKDNTNRNIAWYHGLGTDPTSGTYVFQASFKRTEEPMYAFDLKFENTAASAQRLLRIANGELNDGSTGATTLATLSTDKWTTVRIVVTVQGSNAPYKVYIDDKLAIDKTNKNLNSFKNFRLDLVKNETTSGQLGSILVDNVALYKADKPVRDAFAEPTAISLDHDTISLDLTDTVALTPTITTDGFQPDVAWSSDNEDVATVDENGKVTAVAAGTAKISATIATTSDNLSAECTVSVSNKKIYITENFESGDFKVENSPSDNTVTSPIKNYRDGGVVQHNGITKGPIDATVIDNEGNNVLQINEQPNSAWSRNIYFSHGLKSNPTTGTYVFEASFKSTETPFTQIVLKYENENKDDNAETLYEINSDEFSVGKNYKLNTNSWTTVRVVATLQPSDAPYDVYINDNHVKHGTSARFTSFKSFRLDIIKEAENSDDGLGSILVDNVALYQVADANTVLEDIFYTTVSGTQLNLGDGNIGIKYHVNTDNLLPSNTDQMKFTLDGEVTYVPNTDGKYIFKYGVPAKMMTETITAQLVDANGKALMNPVEYTIRDNALAIINGAGKSTDYEAAAPLAKAMLNYGAYAQQYFGVNTDNLANAGVETDITSVTADSLLAYAGDHYVSVTENSPIGTLAGTVVSLESNTYLRYYFTLNNGVTINDLTFTDENNQALTATMKGDHCVVTIEGINARYLNEPYTVHVTDKENTLVATYCVMSNVYNVLSAPEDLYEDSHINVCKALYLYSVEADKYFTSVTE